MINERKFSSHFSNFWRTCLPNLEAVTRSINLGYERTFYHVSKHSTADRRDIISETGYRLLCLRIANPIKTFPELLPSAETEVIDFFRSNALDSDKQAQPLNEAETLECLSLAAWLLRFVKERAAAEPIIVPQFRGHGALHACNGDVRAGARLFEIKYVDRLFRSSDLKQVLAYCALEYFEKRTFGFSSVFLVNPFQGIYFETSPAELIYSASGRSELDFYEILSYLVSSGEISR